MAVCPATAIPIANPAIPCSDNGVLNTLSTPYFSNNPLVHLKTPPNFTSSPNTIALWLFKKLRSIWLKRNVDCWVYCSKEVHMITLDGGWNVAGINVSLVIGICCWEFENVLKHFGVHFCYFYDPINYKLFGDFFIIFFVAYSIILFQIFNDFLIKISQNIVF